MSAPSQHRLTNAWQGALAGGGDPASSPLYVFGPFVALVVGAGVANITFGASIWLAVVTILVVTLLYRLVMRWVTDGSGGTGLSEEELGPWAAKASAAITCVEYTLTFLVSIAALVTFISDRVGLHGSTAWVANHAWLAIATSVLCGWLVNRGPRVVSYVFGPATGAVLGLLWMMIIAVVWKRGLHLAPLDVAAFGADHLEVTLKGFVRILALITGVEVFANLVASYSGSAERRSALAFRSMSIIMGSTALTMVVVGPAILALSDPARTDVSVFTQTMDALLPEPIAIAGTVVSVLVLLSAAAASALGIQNLFLGLAVRHYAPAALARRNRSGVAAIPVWIEVAIACACFAVLGTHEATYLALYAAGVFVLLSMTSWAAVLRLYRRRHVQDTRNRLTRVASIFAALFTTAATIIVFVERFADGVWMFLIIVPVLWGMFDTVRRLLGDPGAAAERIGRLLARWSEDDPTTLPPISALDAQAHATLLREFAAHVGTATPEDLTHSALLHHRERLGERSPRSVLVTLDGSAHAEHALPFAIGLAREFPLDAHLVMSHYEDDPELTIHYLELIATLLTPHFESVQISPVRGAPAHSIVQLANDHDIDVVIMTSHGRTGIRRALIGSVTAEVLASGSVAVLVVPPPELH